MNTPSHDFCKAVSEAFLHETLDEQNFHQLLNTLKSNRNQVINPISRMHMDQAHRLLDPLYFDYFRAYAIIPGALYAGEIPSSINDDELERKIQTLYELGVTHIVNLTEVNETNFKAIPLRQYAQYAEAYYEQKGREVTCLRYPIRDLDIPTITQMRTTIEALNSILKEGGAPTYIVGEESEEPEQCWVAFSYKTKFLTIPRQFLTFPFLKEIRTFGIACHPKPLNSVILFGTGILRYRDINSVALGKSALNVFPLIENKKFSLRISNQE